MRRNRLEAFSDGVLAIIITIMVLEMKVPHGTDASALIPVIPVFLSYILSFVYLAIYWNNHHHMLHTVRHLTAPILWANMHLLFWLSLIPFATGWMGENHFAAAPAALYAVVLLMASVAYVMLQQVIIASQGSDSVLNAAVKRAFDVSDSRRSTIRCAPPTRPSLWHSSRRKPSRFQTRIDSGP